jgi:ferrous iron transport protein A
VDKAATHFRDLRAGDSARIARFNGLDVAYRNRLMSLGLTPGTLFQVQHIAPLGDPMEIRVRGFHLSLRREEAGDIEVELL